MNKIGLVYWSRHFPKYMQKVVREYLTDKPSIRAEYMEYSREAQVQQKQRRELMYSTHQMTGPLLDRKDKEQFVFQHIQTIFLGLKIKIIQNMRFHLKMLLWNVPRELQIQEKLLISGGVGVWIVHQP